MVLAVKHVSTTVYLLIAGKVLIMADPVTPTKFELIAKLIL